MLASRWDITANKQNRDDGFHLASSKCCPLKLNLTCLVRFEGSLWNFFATFEGNNEAILLGFEVHFFILLKLYVKNNNILLSIQSSTNSITNNLAAV
jgi:hypothetical protein